MWETIIADLEAILAKIKAWAITEEQAVASGAKAFGSTVWNILSQDAQKLATDFWPDLEQIGINLQNTQGGINLANFLPAFITAATPVAEKEGLAILQLDWNIISNAVAGKLNISNTTGNAGTVS